MASHFAGDSVSEYLNIRRRGGKDRDFRSVGEIKSGRAWGMRSGDFTVESDRSSFQKRQEKVRKIGTGADAIGLLSQEAY